MEDRERFISELNLLRQESSRQIGELQSRLNKEEVERGKLEARIRDLEQQAVRTQTTINSMDRNEENFQAGAWAESNKKLESVHNRTLIWSGGLSVVVFIMGILIAYLLRRI